MGWRSVDGWNLPNFWWVRPDGTKDMHPKEYSTQPYRWVELVEEYSTEKFYLKRSTSGWTCAFDGGHEQSADGKELAVCRAFVAYRLSSNYRQTYDDLVRSGKARAIQFSIAHGMPHQRSEWDKTLVYAILHLMEDENRETLEQIVEGRLVVTGATEDSLSVAPFEMTDEMKEEREGFLLELAVKDSQLGLPV